MKRDTSAWIMQTWIFFAIALTFATYGIFNLTGVEGWPKGFLLFSIFSTVATSFTLSKTIRDNKEKQVDTSAWVMQTWVTFGISLAMSAGGLYYLNAPGDTKSFIAVSFLFALSSAFTLAKTIRDNDEADKPVAKENKLL